MDDATSSLSAMSVPHPRTRSGPRLWVTHHADPRQLGRSFPVPAGGLVLGRDATALGGILADRKLSRQHAMVTRLGTGLWIEDLDSRNGTTLDGAPIQRAPVPEGSLIGLGTLRLLMAWGPEGRPPSHPRLLGVGPALRSLLSELEALAHTDTTVLLLGEPGVGKELVAREIHHQSGRTGPFLALNCAGVADTILQSELFGHVKGAFSGAHRDRPGLVHEAAAGTLLLDEIGDASAPFQASLLRLLQERTYRPVGADRDLPAECRFVAATNQDLEASVEGGTFRHDLYTRLDALTLRVPPLRDRRMDIPVLARHLAVAQAGPEVRFTPELSDALVRAAWPGNVRQLEGVVTRMALGAPSGPWPPPDPAEVPPPVRTPDRRPKARPSGPDLEAMLAAHHGNVREVAQILGIGRNTLYRWIRDAGVDLSAARRHRP